MNQAHLERPKFDFSLSMTKLVPLHLNKMKSGSTPSNEAPIHKELVVHGKAKSYEANRQFLNARTVLAAALERGDLESQLIEFQHPIKDEISTAAILAETAHFEGTIKQDVIHLLDRDLPEFESDQDTEAKAYLVTVSGEGGGWRIHPGWLIVMDPKPEDADGIYSFLRPSIRWLNLRPQSKEALESSRNIIHASPVALSTLLYFG